MSGDSGHNTYNFFNSSFYSSAIGDNAHVENRLANLDVSSLVDAIRRTGAALQSYPDSIANHHIDRAEVHQITQWVLSAPEKERLGILLDQPGGGKTVVLRHVLALLEQAAISVLVIKADTLRGVRSPADLAAYLNLPAPVESIANALHNQQLVVLIDQLDALSLTLARDQGTLDVVLDTMARLQQMPHVRIVASCRTFDLRNHPRLSMIQADQNFHLQPLTQEQITSLLDTAGISSTHFLPAHWALLTVPLHLSMYVRLMSGGETLQTDQYRSLQDLYSALWERDIKQPSQAVNSVEVSNAIYTLVDAMQATQQTTVSASVLDSYPDAVNYLLHTGFLLLQRTNLTFFHQTFLDYCYARRFIATNESLANAILSGSQGLFERSQMVQILSFLRGSNPAGYTRELRKLFITNELRPHLRQLLFQWFGNLLMPTNDELAIVRRWTSRLDDLAFFFSFASRNSDWFKLLDQEKIILKLLQSNDERKVSLGVGYLYSFMEQHTQEVLRYFKPYFGASDQWDKSIALGLKQIRRWQNNEEALTMFCTLLEQGKIEGQALYDLASNPRFGCRALRVYFDQRLNNILQRSTTSDENPETISRPFDISVISLLEQYFFAEHGVSEILRQATAVDPKAVIEYILPWMVKITDIFEFLGDGIEGYKYNLIFDHWYGSRGPSDGGSIALLVAQCLRAYAQSDEAMFRSIVESLVAYETLTIHRIITYAYLGSPEIYKDDIYTYISGDRRRLKIGEPTENSVYESCLLYNAVFTYGSPDQWEILEHYILELYPLWELRRPQSYGITQLRFLKAVPSANLSYKALRRLQELERKFPDFRLEPPQGIRSLTIGSPIPSDRIDHMSDTALLKAMQKYDSSTGWGGTRERFFDGGATEFASVIGEKAKTKPDRFARFVLNAEHNVEAIYLSSIISGLAESDLANDQLFTIIRQYASFIFGEFRMSICRALSKRAAEPIPLDLLYLLKEWALTDPDPIAETWTDENPADGDEYMQEAPLQRGINTVRGTAIETFCVCILSQDPIPVDFIFQVIEQVASDPSTAVRACVLYSIERIMHLDPARTAILVGQVIEGHPKLLQSTLTHNLLYRLYYGFFPQIRPWIERLLENPNAQSRQAGARLCCLAAFRYQEALELAQYCMTGDTALRRGAAQVYAHNIDKAAYFDLCLGRLEVLFHDTDADVRREASECFEYLDIEHLDTTRNFLDTFLSSPALLEGASSLVKYIKHVAVEDPLLALTVTSTILGRLEDAQTTTFPGHGLMEDDLVSIPLNIYLHTDDQALKTQAIDLFEQFLIKQSWGAAQALQEWDRR